MRTELLRLARGNGGVITRRDALARVGKHIVDDAVRSGVLVAAFPGVYVLAEFANEKLIRRLAALAYAPGSALSHTDALEIWDLPAPPRLKDIHVTVRAHRPPVRQPGLVVHRRNAVDVERDAVRRGGLAVVRIEQAIVESWPLLPLVDRRAPALVGLRDGRTTADALLACLSRQPTAAGANEMRRLFRLVEDGCHSELELWGHDKVFSDPSVPRSERQHPVSLGVRTIYLDRYFEQEMVAVELDGAAYHGLPGQRERDLQRDASLARRGILVVRYSHRRLHAGPHEVIDELLAILAMRRAQLRVA